MSNNKIDEVNNPPWYESEGGVKCIEITRHMNSNLGHVIRYVWRAGKKGEGVEFAIKDLNKAMVYLKDEIQRLKDNEVKNKKAEEVKENQVKDIGLNRLPHLYKEVWQHDRYGNTTVKIVDKKVEEVKEVRNENEICYERLNIIYDDINTMQRRKLYFMSLDSEFTDDPVMLKSDALKSLDEDLYKLKNQAITEHKRINKIYNSIVYKQKLALT